MPANRPSLNDRNCRPTAAYAALSWALLTTVAVPACKSAEDKCTLAQNAAEQAWQMQLTDLQAQAKQARAAQASSETKLIKEIEPRLAQAAEKAASARYNRDDDAWMRAYKANQNAACARDPECARTKQTNAEAKDKQQNLVPKLMAVQAALATVRGAADKAWQAAQAVMPELGNQLLDTAKQHSAAAYAACKDLKPKADPSLPAERR